MDTDSNRLISSLHPDLEKLMGGGDYEEIPNKLEQAAKVKLQGKMEAQVSKTSGGKLSKWAAGRRKKKRRIAKMVKMSKRKNR